MCGGSQFSGKKMKRLFSLKFIGTPFLRCLFLSVVIFIKPVNCISGPAEINKFLIIVGYSIYKTGLLTVPLDVYRSDIYGQGWEASIITVSKFDPNADYVCQDETALKSVIKSYYQNGCKGFVLIGSNDIPLVWWRYRYSDPKGCDPTDLYYTDMDEWKSKKDSMYVSYDAGGAFVGSAFGPEMFCGRICTGGSTATVDEEAMKVAFYLNKIHQYRANNGNLTDEQKNRALTFLDSDDYNHKDIDSWPENAICSNLHTLCDNNVTNILNFISEIEKGYRFIHIRAHSNRNYNEFITTDLLREIQPRFNFLNLCGCYACNYTTENFGGVYLFDNNYSLNITGSTGGWGVSPDEKFYKDLSVGVPVGIAFQAFINRDIYNVVTHPPDGEAGWPKGVLLGDPLLTYAAEIKTYKTPTILTNLIDLHADVGSQFSLKLSAHNPDLRSFQYKMSNPPLNATLVDSTINWTPPAGSEGIHFFEIKAVDDIKGGYSEIFTITVNSHSDKLVNGGFEEGITNYLEAWFPGPIEGIYRWDSTGIAHTGERSLYIYAPIRQRASVKQYIQLKPFTNYVLTGWMKGRNISAPKCHFNSLNGATLIAVGQTILTPLKHDLTGTFDWIQDSCVFQTSENGLISIACTLGECSSATTGEAWFDDITLRPQNNSTLLEDLVIKDMKIFPNPSDGDFYIEYFNTKEQQTHVVLTNPIGQTVYSDRYLSVCGSNKKKFSLNGLKVGAYILTLVTGNDCSAYKILIR